MASQAFTFVDTRDPEKLAAMKERIENDLLDRATEAVATFNSDDAARRAFPDRLKGSLARGDFERVAGLRDLTLSGYVDKNDTECVVRMSKNLAERIQKGEMGALAEMPDVDDTEVMERREMTRVFANSQPDKWLCVECRTWFVPASFEAIEARQCLGPCRKWFCVSASHVTRHSW